MPASITLTVAHLPTSTSFFLSCLHPLNYVYRGRVNDTIGFGHPDAAPDFWITQSIPGVPPGPAHVAFPATSRGKVHEFFQAALKAGGKCHGEPVLRDACGYYSAAIIDFDGNSIEAVFRPDLLEDNKENAAGDAKSVVSTAKSVAKSKAPTVVSSASKAKSAAPSKVGSVAPSVAPSRVPTQAPGSVAGSVAPSAAPSRAPTQAAGSVAPSAAPRSTVSRAPTAAGAPSEAPARTTISRTPTAPAALPGSGNNIIDMMNEARGTVNFARELVNQARPMMNSSAPAGDAATQSSSPNSHAPSDAIVGTLLGVAAGAALHYAFSNRNKPTETASAPVTPPEHYINYQHPSAQSESSPSYTQERYYYYHQQPRVITAGSEAPSRPYAIEPPSSEVSRASNRSGQKLLEMVDRDGYLSDIAPSTVRPRRRSSFSIAVSNTKSSASKASTVKMLEGPPPTSYRGPTVVTTAGSEARSSPGSRAGSVTRTYSISTVKPADEGYASATEGKSRVSRSSSTHSQRRHGHHHHRSRRSSSASKASAVTAIRSPEQTPLPASRAASQVDRESFYSTHSKPNKTVIGRLTEKQLSKLEEGGRLQKGQTDVTRSVIGKIKEVDRMDLTGKEIRPEDSVSQVSSSRGSRRSRK